MTTTTNGFRCALHGATMPLCSRCEDARLTRERDEARARAAVLGNEDDDGPFMMSDDDDVAEILMMLRAENAALWTALHQFTAGDRKADEIADDATRAIADLVTVALGWVDDVGDCFTCDYGHDEDGVGHHVEGCTVGELCKVAERWREIVG